MDVAIDFHDIPYYGEPIDPKPPQFVKTQEARGTHRTYHYASLDLLCPHFRLTFSVRDLRQRGVRHRAVLRALADARRCGVEVRRLYLDREFYEYATLGCLRTEGYTVITPLRLGSRQRERWGRGQRSYVTEHLLRDPRGKGEPLALRVHVVVRYQAGKKWNRRGAQYLVYQVLGHVADGARPEGNYGPFGELPRPRRQCSQIRREAGGGDGLPRFVQHSGVTIAFMGIGACVHPIISLSAVVRAERSGSTRQTPLQGRAPRQRVDDGQTSDGAQAP